MKNKLFRAAFALVLIPLFLYCKKGESGGLEIISVDISSVKPLDISRGKIIKLETTDESLLYDIGQLEFLNDKLIILSREAVRVFNKDGKFLFNVSGKGNGPEEYTSLSNIFVKNGRIYLFDSMTKKVLSFTENGEFLSSADVGSDVQLPLSHIYPLKNGGFIGKNKFWGTPGAITPLGSLLDENYQFVDTIQGKVVTSSLTSKDNFFQYDDHILYWEFLNDTLYSITNQTVAPRYFVDFGSQSIPDYERGKDVYEIIAFWNRPENRDRIALMVGFVNEDDAYLRFRFFYKQQSHYVCYNKGKGVIAYRLEDKSEEFRMNGYVGYQNGRLYVAAVSEGESEENPCLVVFERGVLDE